MQVMVMMVLFYMWKAWDQFPGQSELVWKSEDKFSDDDDDSQKSCDYHESYGQESRDVPSRVQPLHEHSAAINIPQ